MTKGLGGKQEGSSRFPEQVKLTGKMKKELCSPETLLQNTPGFNSRKVFYNSSRRIVNKQKYFADIQAFNLLKT